MTPLETCVASYEAAIEICQGEHLTAWDSQLEWERHTEQALFLADRLGSFMLRNGYRRRIELVRRETPCRIERGNVNGKEMNKKVSERPEYQRLGNWGFNGGSRT